MNRLMTSFFLFFLVFLSPLRGQAQYDTTITVPLMVTFTHEPTARAHTLLEKYPPPLVGLPEHMDTVLFWSVYTNWKQNVYESYQKGEISKAEFQQRNIKPEEYTTRSLQHSIYACSGFRNGKKVIVLDTNHNGDLSDEQVIELDTNLTLEQRLGEDYLQTPMMNVEYDHVEAGTVHRMKATVRVDPFLYLMKPPSKLIADLKFSLLQFEEYKGTLQLGNQKFNILMKRKWPDGRPSEIRFINYGQLENERKDAFLPMEIGQKVFIEDTFYELTDFDPVNNQLIIKQISRETEDSVTGGRVGMTAPVFQGEAFGSEQVVSVGGQQEKYTFLHSWGTWCAPCKADHDELIRMYHRLDKTAIQFVGLAVDDNQKGVSAYISKKQMIWNNLFFTHKASQETDSLIKGLYIRSYPTYLILDKEGIVVARGGSGELANMEAKLRLLTQ